VAGHGETPPPSERGAPAGEDGVLKMLAEGYDRSLELLRAFVAIPSVSTDPDRAGEVRRAARWVADRLEAIPELEVQVWDTPRHPAV
jgi:acetylornithine deacetylase/succinyl-diaminopimelate desuccinylase-like protein